jgi:hypothetical protein
MLAHPDIKIFHDLNKGILFVTIQRKKSKKVLDKVFAQKGRNSRATVVF